MSGKTYFMCMSVRGAIKRLRGERKNSLTGMRNEQGRELRRDEAIDALLDELAKGNHVLPMGDLCDNPCGHADKGCPGFDYSEGGGCPGYCRPSAEATSNENSQRGSEA